MVATVGSAGLDPVVVAKPDSPLPKLDCRVLSRAVASPSHPLTGVVAALGASAGRGVVAIACDMPLVPSKLLTWLAQLEEPVAVCEVGGRLEPLLGRYSPAGLRARSPSALDAGAAMRDAVAALDPFVIPEDRVARFGDPARIFFNVNSPEDLAAAEEMLGHTGRFSLPFSRDGPGGGASLRNRLARATAQADCGSTARRPRRVR